jgi:hypothetical protein
MFIMTIFLWFTIFHVGYVLSLDCELTSREYQVVLRPELMTPSFKNGVTTILDELTKIEKAKVIDFKVSLSSLQYKNVSVTEYVLPSTRNPSDCNVPLRFKSRQKKPTEPADIVMKTSNGDPELACWPLKVHSAYVDSVNTKFELDVYAENGRIISKTAHSYVIDLPVEFNPVNYIDISQYLTNAASKLTVSGMPLIVVPDPLGTVIMQTAEFDIRLLGQKFGAEVFLLQRLAGLQTEFSFKIKDPNVGWEILLAAQNLIAEISQIRSIALLAS